MKNNRYLMLVMLAVMVVLQFGFLASSARATDLKEDFYWNGKNYGRGVGTIPPGTCGDKEEQNGLCYNKCKDGYHGEGPVCWENKPGNPSYGRGAGTVPALHWVHARLEQVCHGDKEKDSGLCYAKCKADYHGVGPMCWTNNALSMGRGAGLVPKLVCKPGQDQDAGLCYEPCHEGYAGAGPVCWGKVPQHYVICGAGFAKDESTCKSIVKDQASSVEALFSDLAGPELRELQKARQKKMSEKEVKAATGLVKELQPFMGKAKAALQPLKDFSKSAGETTADLRKAWSEFMTPAVKASIDSLLTSADIKKSVGAGQDSDIDLLRDASALASKLPLGDDPVANGFQDTMAVIAAYMYSSYDQ